MRISDWSSDVCSSDLLDPASIINRLCHYLTRSPVTLKFDQHQRTVGSQGEQVDNAAIACPLLPADQHPFVRKNTRRGDDHILQPPLAGQACPSQRPRRVPEIGTASCRERVCRTV